jgi:hypothetical protein
MNDWREEQKRGKMMKNAITIRVRYQYQYLIVSIYLPSMGQKDKNVSRKKRTKK